MAQGLTLPGHLGSIRQRWRGEGDIRGAACPSGRHLHPQRPLPGRHAPARHLHVQADLRGGELLAYAVVDLPPHRCGRPCAGLERLGFHRDLPGRPAHPAAQAVRARVRERNVVRHDRAQRAMPDVVFGDLRAQLAACHIAERGIRSSSRATARRRFDATCDELLDYAERLTRAAIARPAGRGAIGFEDRIDDDGVDVGKPIPLRVTIDKQGRPDRGRLDRRLPQVKGAINNTCRSPSRPRYCAIKSVLPATCRTTRAYSAPSR